MKRVVLPGSIPLIAITLIGFEKRKGPLFCNRGSWLRWGVADGRVLAVDLPGYSKLVNKHAKGSVRSGADSSSRT